MYLRHFCLFFLSVPNFKTHWYWAVPVAGDIETDRSQPSWCDYCFLLRGSRGTGLFAACCKRSWALGPVFLSSCKLVAWMASIWASHVAQWVWEVGEPAHHSDVSAICCTVSNKLSCSELLNLRVYFWQLRSCGKPPCFSTQESPSESYYSLLSSMRLAFSDCLVSCIR